VGPLEVFLYDWWPIRAEARLFERLSAMPVRIEYEERTPSEAWRSDRPAVQAAIGGIVGSGFRGGNRPAVIAREGML
jgi:hypothetical protein